MKVESDSRAFTECAGALGSIPSNTQAPTQIRSSTHVFRGIKNWVKQTCFPYRNTLALSVLFVFKFTQVFRGRKKTPSSFFQNVILMPQLDIAKSCCTKRTWGFLDLSN